MKYIYVSQVEFDVVRNNVVSKVYETHISASDNIEDVRAHTRAEIKFADRFDDCNTGYVNFISTIAIDKEIIEEAGYVRKENKD